MMLASFRQKHDSFLEPQLRGSLIGYSVPQPISQARGYLHKISARSAIFAVFLCLAFPAKSGLSKDANGWTTFTPSNDSRLIYVAATEGTGNCSPHDDNDAVIGADPFHPTVPASINTCRTIAAAKALMRAGFPDWILLRKGDTWTDEEFGRLSISGRSEQERLLISAYGTGPRPLVKTMQSWIFSDNGGGTPPTLDHYAMTGIHVYAYERDWRSSQFVSTFGNEQLRLLIPGANVLIEDMKFQAPCGNSIQNFTGAIPNFLNVELNRNVFIDSYSCGGHASAIYIQQVDGLTITGNVFDHNGWGSNRDGASPDNMLATIFNHNLYLQGHDRPGSSGPPSFDVVVTDNIFTDASSHGIQIRPGGRVENNFFARNPIAIHVGNNETPGGQDNIVQCNVIVEGNAVNASYPRGWGIESKDNGSVFATIFNANLIVQDINTDDTNVSGLILTEETSPNNDFRITNNYFYEWRNGCPLGGGGNTNITQEIGNVYWEDPGDSFCPSIPPGNFDANTAIFSNPGATTADYDAAVGGPGTYTNFITKVRSMSKDTWDKNYHEAGRINNWFHKQYEVLSPAGVTKLTDQCPFTGISGLESGQNLRIPSSSPN